MVSSSLTAGKERRQTVSQFQHRRIHGRQEVALGDVDGRLGDVVESSAGFGQERHDAVLFTAFDHGRQG